MSGDLRQRLALYDSGRWFQFPIGLLHFLPDREAILLASIINIMCMKEPEEVLDGWCKISMARLERSLHCTFSTFKAQRALSGLKSKGIIQTKLEQGRDHWISIVYEKLEQLDSSNPSGRKSATTAIAVAGSGRKSARAGVAKVLIRGSGEPRGTRDSGSLKNLVVRTRWVKMAETLKDAITRVHLVPRSAKPSRWASSFRKLHTCDGYPIDKIEHILKWYCRALPNADKFTPVVECGDTFRSKFAKLDACMRRNGVHSEPSKKNKPKTVPTRYEDLPPEKRKRMDDLFRY